MSEKKEKKDDCEHGWKQLGTEHVEAYWSLFALNAEPRKR